MNDSGEDIRLEGKQEDFEIMTIKIQEYLTLAQEILVFTREALESSEFTKNFVTKMHFGFGNKMCSSLEALLSDALNNRTESIHHLKTLVESFIYLFWMRQDEKRAKLLYLEALNAKIKYFEANPDYPDKSVYLEAWNKAFNETQEGIENEWKAFKNNKKLLAEAGKVLDVYNRII